MDNINYQKIDNHPKEAVRFFKIMMRLEYALKVCGFAEMTRAGLEIQWDKFANNQLGKAFFEHIQKSGNADTLIGAPPSQQILREDNSLDFDPVAECRSVQDLMGTLRRTRNNLLHGGKAGDPDHDRNDTLIAEAIYVIEEVLKADDQLRFEFEGLA